MNPRPPEIPPHKLISTLQGFNLLPAIIFMPTRRKCDESAIEVANDRSQRTDPDRQQRRQEIFDAFAAEFPEIRHHKHARTLLNTGVASHHAGHIPAWKLVIEKMMSSGLLNAIFATSTVAAGVDFPARTVVISNADTRGNDGWRPLFASELQQMTGRAGRRGKDNVGFVVLVPGQFQDPKKIASLLKAPPDPLESQFRSTYTSLLNLLDAFNSFDQVREIAKRSFAYRNTNRKIEQLKQEEHGLCLRLEEALKGSKITLADARGFERLASALERVRTTRPSTRIEMRLDWLRRNVIPGRVVSQGRSGKRIYFVISVHGEKVAAMRDDGHGTAVGFDRITRVFKNIYPIKEDSIEQAFLDTFGRKNPALEEPKLSANAAETDGAELVLTEAMDRLAAGIDAQDKDGVLATLWASAKDAAEIERMNRDIAYHHGEIWSPFERRAKVLDHFGYIDFMAEEVTAAGKWLADVRVDRTLLIGEALRRGLLGPLSPGPVAGLIASLAADPDRNFGELSLSSELLDAVNAFEDVIDDVSSVEWQFGIEPSEEINLSAAAAAEQWCQGASWPELVKRTQAEEGDLFRLLSRTGEALMQIAQLRDSNADAAGRARSAAEQMLRDPIR